MKIDQDIIDKVDAMNPKTLGQRVAIEQTLQRKRDTAREIERGLAKLAAEKDKRPISLGKATSIDPTFTGSQAGGGMIQVPAGIMRALLRAVGGSITLDRYDLADDTGEELEFLMFSDPYQVRIQLKEPDSAGDPGDREGYHGFTGVH